jgi:selenocysteine lyase/cysteine desulfurase
MILSRFTESLPEGEALMPALRAGLIGEGMEFDGPFGRRKLVYADYTASGRALAQVEAFIAGHILPFYANSHTEASHCGAFMTRARAEARAVIARELNAGPGISVIFAGAGATAGINRLVALLIPEAGISPALWEGGLRPLVVHGPYEHHSNILPWRESGADVVEVGEAEGGGPDMQELERVLGSASGRPLIIGAFSAASNVTGIETDVVEITRLLKRHGALAVWDYAGGGPYLPIDMRPAPDAQIDAVVISPHKFPGGPGASGILALREAVVRRVRPAWPGGGTVSFVSPWGEDYSTSLTAREEAGTPDMLGDIRAALAFLVKQAVGCETIVARDKALAQRAFSVWDKVPELEILACDKRGRLPIFSFRVKDPAGGYIHQQLVTRMLSDHYGIQARGGCACAGPYAHRLLDIDQETSEALRGAIAAGREIEKPGWCRLNLGYLCDDATVGYIIDSVAELATRATELQPLYACDPATARFSVAS